MTLHQAVASVGLALDIIGALVIVLGVARLGDAEITQAASTVMRWADPAQPNGTPNPELEEILRLTKRDARRGAALLVAGFVGQLAAVWV